MRTVTLEDTARYILLDVLIALQYRFFYPRVIFFVEVFLNLITKGKCHCGVDVSLRCGREFHTHSLRNSDTLLNRTQNKSRMIVMYSS